MGMLEAHGKDTLGVGEGLLEPWPSQREGEGGYQPGTAESQDIVQSSFMSSPESLQDVTTPCFILRNKRN